MGDTSEPPSGAAQGARIIQDTGESGFFSRLFERTKPGTNGAEGAAPRGGTNGHSISTESGLISLRHLNVEDVAVPKAEIIAVPKDIELADLVEVYRSSGLTRLPVFDETLDSPLGFIHLKDLALKHGFNGKSGNLDIENLLRPLLFAPPSMPAQILMQKMQSERSHLALVIDEYGGVDGLVTIEDMIEQVVGEIEDEHDSEEDELWSKESTGVYICQSKAPLDEFEHEIGVALLDRATDDEIETLGGLVFLLTGRVPVRGEVIKHPTGIEFEIVDADSRRIKRMKVCLPQAAGS